MSDIDSDIDFAPPSPRREAVLVRGIPCNTSPENCELLEMYFGSKKRSGGGEVEEVVPIGEDRVKVVFSKDAEPGGKCDGRSIDEHP